MILGEVRGRGARRERQTNKKAAKQKEAHVVAVEPFGDGHAVAVAGVYPTSGGNSVSFGVPMRRDSCTSQGLQPWLISTSDCTDMYM